MTSKTKRWMMSLPLVMLPFTVSVAPTEAEAGLEGCFAFVNFFEGGLNHGTSCALAIVGSPSEEPLGTTHIVDTAPFPMPGTLISPTDTDGPGIEEFVNDIGNSMTGFHIHWEVPINIGFLDIGFDPEIFDVVELMGDPGAITGV